MNGYVFCAGIVQNHRYQMSFVRLAVPCKGMQIVSFGISLEGIRCDCRALGNLFFSVERSGNLANTEYHDQIIYKCDLEFVSFS